MSISNWTRASATCIGSSHLKSSTECQDFHRTLEITCGNSGYLILVASDGAGSYEYGKIGAVIVNQTLSALAKGYVRENHSLPSGDTLYSWFQYLQLRLLNIASQLETDIKQLSSTALMTISSEDETVCAHVGDGAIVWRDISGKWETLSEPENGEYASTTYFVSDTKSLRLRTKVLNEPVTAISLFTDGIESLVLDAKTNQPFNRFFEPFYKKLTSQKLSEGKDFNFSNQLKLFLGSEKVNQRTDDDKTLIIAAKR